MAATLVLLRLEHRNFLRVLDVLDRVGRRIERGEDYDAALLDLIFEYLLGYPDCCHHPKEDLVLRQLRRVAPEEAERVGDLINDHQELGQLVRRAAEHARRAGGRGDATLAVEVRHVVDVYREHLQTEERVFFPTVERVLRPVDWEVVDFTMFDQPDPLFDEPAEQYYQRLRGAIFDRQAGEPPPGAAEAEA